MKKRRIKHGDLLLSVSGKFPQTYLKIIVPFFLRRILYQVKRRIQNPKNIYCADNPGDMFFYVRGEIR